MPRGECKWPEFLICPHGCDEIIQLVSHVSGEVEFELCATEAKRMAQVLAGQVGCVVVPREHVLCFGDEVRHKRTDRRGMVIQLRSNRVCIDWMDGTRTWCKPTSVERTHHALIWSNTQ